MLSLFKTAKGGDYLNQLSQSRPATLQSGRTMASALPSILSGGLQAASVPTYGAGTILGTANKLFNVNSDRTRLMDKGILPESASPASRIMGWKGNSGLIPDFMLAQKTRGVPNQIMNAVSNPVASIPSLFRKSPDMRSTQRLADIVKGTATDRLARGNNNMQVAYNYLGE